jgi:AcrR family transcriptional regulator
MGISERREREKIERRRTILQCARELILLQGVEKVSMEDIAQKAELSKATVYLYFSSKEILFNEICEDAARIFLEHIKPVPEPQQKLTGLEALKYFWRGFVELFGNTDDMVIIFKVRNFLEPGLTNFLLNEHSKSPNVNAIIKEIKNLIDRCKAEGFFDPNLDSAMATGLFLSMFSIIVEKAAGLPLKDRNFPAIIEEMTNSFQIIIRGFAREGIDRSLLDIVNA